MNRPRPRPIPPVRTGAAALLHVPEACADADWKTIAEGLRDYNGRHVPTEVETLSVLLRDPSSRATLGGLWGHTYLDWTQVEMLFVPEALRGQGLGSRLLARCEMIARQRGCVGIWLDTFSFQAPDFYLKNGYRTFGVLDAYPAGCSRSFLSKAL